MTPPPGMMPRADAAATLKLDDAALQRLLDAGALEASDDGAFITQTSVLLHLTRRVHTTLDAHQTRATAGWQLALEGTALPVLLGLLLLAWLVQLFGWRDGTPILPTPTLAASTAATLGLCTFLARRQPDLTTINGFGTRLYGHTPSPQGVVTTAFVVALMVPLVPFASYVLLEEGPDDGDAHHRRRDVMLRPLPSLHLPQALSWTAAAWATLALLGWAFTHWT